MNRLALLSAAQVAERLGIPLQRFYRKRRALRAAGFPEPLPGLTGRYSPAQIDAWLAAPGAAAHSAGPEAAPSSLAAWQAELDRRASANKAV